MYFTYLLVQSPRNQPIQSGVRTGRDKQNVGRIDLHRFATQLSRRIAFGHIDDGALEHLEHALLDALAADVAQLMDAGNGSDFVHLVEEHDAQLGAFDTAER